MNKFAIIALIGLALTNGKKLSMFEEPAAEGQDLAQAEVAPEDIEPSVVDLVKAHEEAHGHHMKTFDEYEEERLHKEAVEQDKADSDKALAKKKEEDQKNKDARDEAKALQSMWA